jgi:putative RNA 2'-phosphotransferase
MPAKDSSLRDFIAESAEVTSVSRLLSRVLRHEPELVGLKLDAGGWADIEKLLLAIHRASRAVGAPKRLRSLPTVDRTLLDRVVLENDKRRFTISEDGKCIRAAQGHSVQVDLGYRYAEPPEILFHGTAAASLASIERQGLVPKSRHAVHLSSTSESARAVGARHGRPVVLIVLAGRMHQEGHRFSRADNGVWLTEWVPPNYLRREG